MSRFFVNGEQVDFRAAPDTPLLRALRGSTRTSCSAAIASRVLRLSGMPAVEVRLTAGGKPTGVGEPANPTGRPRGRERALRAHRQARAPASARFHAVDLKRIATNSCKSAIALRRNAEQACRS